MNRANHCFVALCMLVSSCLIPVMVFGHHSAVGRFDPLASMQIEGEITRVHWRNPHAQITLDVTEEDGTTTKWLLEAGVPNQLRRFGLERSTLKVGDRVKVAGWPPVTPKREMFVSNILSPTGEEWLFHPHAKEIWTAREASDRSFFKAKQGDASRPELGIFRVWSFTTESPFLFPQSLNPKLTSQFPLTESARASVEGFDGAKDNPLNDCRPKGMPLIMETPAPVEFVQSGENIRLLIEEYDLVREIHMGSDADKTKGEASLLGYSVGRWEDLKLIVTTTHINWGWFDQGGIPLTEQAEVLERFTLAEDGSRLDYTITVTDESTFTEPVTFERYFLYVPGETIMKFDCDASQNSSIMD